MHSVASRLRLAAALLLLACGPVHAAQDVTVVASNPDLNGDGVIGDDIAGNIGVGAFGNVHSLVTAGQMVNLLNAADLSVAADNDVTVDSFVIWNSARSMTLQAVGGTIAVNGMVSNWSTGAIVLNAGLRILASSMIRNEGAQSHTTGTGESFYSGLHGAGALTMNVAGSAFTGQIGGFSSLTKQGAGTLVLSLPNVYNGTTDVQAGTLRVANNESGSATGVSSVIVQSSATLTGNGRIEGAVQVASGGRLSPGIGSLNGTLLFVGGLGFANGSVIDFSVGPTGDRIHAHGGAVVGAPVTGGVTVNFSNGGNLAPGQYVLIDAEGSSLSSFEASDFVVGTTVPGFDFKIVLVGQVLSVIVTNAGTPQPPPAPTTWELRGTINFTEGDLPPEVAVGAGIRLLMTYDTSAPLLLTRSDNAGGLRYDHASSSVVFKLYVDGIDEPFMLLPTTGGGIFLRDNYLSNTGNGTPTVPTDGITVFGQTGYLETDGDDFSIIIRGPDTTVYSGDVLPLVPDPRLMLMPLRGFQYCRWENGRTGPSGEPKPCASGVNATITSIRRITGPQLADFSLRSNVVSGCKNVVATATLDAPAPAGGRIVTLGDSLSSASVVAKLTIPGGALSKTATVKTTPVASDETGVVTATVDGLTLEDSLTVRPMGITSLTVQGTNVIGGASVLGTVKLECAAGPGAVPVDMTSSMPGVAQSSVATVMVPAGQTSAPVTINTAPVTTKQRPVITATAGEVQDTITLNVLPAATISATSLKFPNTVVGATSAPLSVTLHNQGVAPITVSTIALTGTYTGWFLMSHGCPVSLPGGASCNIDVQFKPLSAVKKTAKLAIDTSGTATPFSVALSGTGVP